MSGAENAERLAKAMGMEVSGIGTYADDETGFALFDRKVADGVWHRSTLDASEIATLLSFIDRAAQAEALAEALSACNGALIGASEALQAHGFSETVATLSKYIEVGEKALTSFRAGGGE